MPDIIQIDERYYISATSSMADDRTRVLKHADTFGVFDRWGDIQPIGLREQGLYHHGTRFLSSLTLTLDGARPLLLSSTVRREDSVMTVDMMNPDLVGDVRLPRGALHLLRSKFLWDATCHERIRITSYALDPIAVRLRLTFDADWADVFEVRGTARERRGTSLEQRMDDGGTTLGYRGLDGVVRRLRLVGDPVPTEIGPDTLGWDFELLPQEVRDVFFSAACAIDAGPAVVAWEPATAGLREWIDGARARHSRVESSNPQLDDWILRSLSDLHLLVTETERGPYPYAGVPWFSTPFGRDGIVTAIELLWTSPGIARGVLSFLAATQATEADPEKDAQPGKILHEMRSGEMAALGEIPFGRYYGSVDATPLFVVLADAYLRRTDDVGFLQDLWPHVEAALAWMERDGDRDGDGFLEYVRESSDGLRNQGWKDSGDSVFHADGTLAEGPIALCEVQGYAYAAWRGAARIARALGRESSSSTWERRAKDLRDRFERAFWCEDLGSYAIALDGGKRVCRVRTSNPGHCLWSGIVAPGRARRVASMLLSEDMFSGFGVRTVARGEVRYDPMSYHNGSVWPHDNALIALGLARYGFHHEMARILEGMYEASLSIDLHRLPELICGFQRREGEGPTLYPVACSPQAWSAGAVFALLQATLGLSIDARRRRLHLDRARLPRFVDRLRLFGLRVGDAEIDLLLHRQVGDVGVNVTRREGDVAVVSVK